MFPNYQSLFACLTRIFQFTNKISWMHFEFFDMNTVESVIACMRNIEIEGFVIYDSCSQDVR